jgi:hypothetical protein
MPKADSRTAIAVAAAIAPNTTEVRLCPACVKVFNVGIGLNSHRRFIELCRVSCIRIVRRRWFFSRLRDQVRRSRDHFVVRSPVAVNGRVLPDLHRAIDEDVFALPKAFSDIGQRPVKDKVVPVGMLLILLISRRESVALSEPHGRDFGSTAEKPDLRIATEIAC